VVYDVADLAPFLTALDEAACAAVVVELTPVHPWSHLAPYFRALHGLELPREPTAALCCEVVAETIGVDPSVRAWRRRGVHRFADRQELLAYYGRRLLVPAERADELERVLGPDIGRDGGWLVLGDVEREAVTVSWVTGSR
jgi:hypothetical protein